MISKHIHEEVLRLFFLINDCPIFTDAHWATLETTVYKLSNVLKLDEPELCEDIEKVYIDEFNDVRLLFKYHRFGEQLKDCMISEEEEKDIKEKKIQIRLSAKDKIVRRIATILNESELFTDEPLG